MASPNYNLPEKLDLTACNVGDEWRRFKQSLEIYLMASGLSDKGDNRKIAILLNLIGEECVKIYNTFVFGEDEKTFENVLKKFENYCEPKKNVLHARYLFYKRKQEEGERFDSFLTEVKNLVKNCAFTAEDEAVRDRLVFGCNDDETQKKIIIEGDMQLEEVINKLRLAEVTKKQAKEVQEKDVCVSKVVSQPGGKRFNKSKRPGSVTSSPSGVINCRWCGQQHVPGKQMCPAQNKECSKCHRLNHFAAVCRSRDVRAITSNEADESDEEFYCNSITVKNCNTVNWYQELKLEKNFNCRFKLDTGSDVNLLPFNLYEKLEKEKNVVLKKSKVKLLAYNGSEIRAFGSILVEVEVKSKLFYIDFIVTEKTYEPTLGKETCLLLGLIERKYVNSIETESKKEKIIKEYKSVFEGKGEFPKKYTIKLKENSQPVSKPPHRVPLKLKEPLRVELDRLCQIGVISKIDEPTEWVNRIVVVEKDGGSIRVCLDPKELNKCILKKYYEIPTINDLKTSIGKAKYFSLLDLKESFWQIKLDEDSKKYCTFSTIYGNYCFNVLPFGLQVSAEVFQENCISSFAGIDNLFISIDDFLVYGETLEQHDIALKRVLDRAKELNIKFNVKKFQYLQDNTRYFGHEIISGFVMPDKEKIQAIQDYDLPNDRESLQRFIGFVNYLREFIPNLSEIISPLRELLKKDVHFVWEKSHDDVVEKIKKVLISPPVLQNFDVYLKTVIQTDSSKNAIGSVLLQNGHPIAFASKSLTDNECEWGQIDKEFLAILFACQKFHYYVYGRKAVVQSDHQPLVSLMNKEISAISSQRLKKIRLKLSVYDIDVQYVQGKKLFIADAISRASSKAKCEPTEKCLEKMVHTVNVSDELLDQIVVETKNDECLSELIKLYKNGWPADKSKVPNIVKFYYKMKNEIFVENEIVYLDHRIVIPLSLKRSILAKIHQPHLGINKTTARAKSLFYWPGMSDDIAELVARCELCAKYSANKKKEPMIVDKIMDLPFKKIACDFLNYANENYLILADYYSKWYELVKVNSLSASTVIKICKKMFATHGIPQIVRADNVPFNSLEFSNIAKDFGFVVITSSPNYPKSNGFIERMVGVAKNMLKKCIECNADNEYMLLEYRNTPVLGSTYTPAQLLLSRQTRSKFPIHDKLLRPKVIEDFISFQDKKNKVNKNTYDKSATRSNHKFDEKQNVWYRKDNKWEPGEIVKICKAPRSVLVNDKRGLELRRNTAHVKPRIVTVTEESEIDSNNVKDSNLKFCDVKDDKESLESDDSSGSDKMISERPKRTIVLPKRFKDYQVDLKGKM